MKKLKIFLSVFAIIMLSIGFVACETNYKSFAGIYMLTARTQNSTTLSVDEMVANNIIVDQEQEKIILNEDQTFSSSGIVGIDNGTYVITDSTIVFKTETKDFVGTIENGKITISVDSNIYYFVK